MGSLGWGGIVGPQSLLLRCLHETVIWAQDERGPGLREHLELIDAVHDLVHELLALRRGEAEAGAVDPDEIYPLPSLWDAEVAGQHGSLRHAIASLSHAFI